ncbi:MAG: C45 family autoproteolytic acyltransferase/hydrolase, partial [Bryobacteraceae bacterium]
MPVSRRTFLGALTSACAATAASANGRLAPTVPLHGAFRAPAKNGWTFVHLQGTPSEIGFAHGYLLAPEIEDAKAAIELSSTHQLKQSWAQLRQAAQQVFWPKVPKEYREEIEGIDKGLKARGSHLDLMDVVAMNASMEFSYYYDEQKREKDLLKSAKAEPADHCSAFVANGAYTKDGRIVIGHNNWSDYLTGSRWDIIFDIAPASGHRILMDGVPGLIDSADDFGINSAGLMITETTIGHFHGFDV